MDFMPSELSKMNHSDFLSQLDKWEAALDGGEPLDHCTEANKPAVESFKEPSSEVMGITELEAFLDEMSNFDSVCK